MNDIIIYDSEHKPCKPSEITLAQIFDFDYEIVMIDDTIYHNTETLDSLQSADVWKLLGVLSLKYFNESSLYMLRDSFCNAIEHAKRNEQIVILIKNNDLYIFADCNVKKQKFYSIINKIIEVEK